MQTDSLDSVRDQTDTMSLQELPMLIGAVEVNTSYHSEECGWAYMSTSKILATVPRFPISCFNKFSVDKLESYAVKNNGRLICLGFIIYYLEINIYKLNIRFGITASLFSVLLSFLSVLGKNLYIIIGCNNACI